MSDKDLYRCIDSDNEDLIIKFIYPQIGLSADNEYHVIKRLRKADVEGITEILRGEWSDNRQVYAQVMKEIPGMDLLEWVKSVHEDLKLGIEKLSDFEATTIQIFKKILTILEKIHEAGVAHRDLILDNIMISQHPMTITIIDFEFACYTDSGRCNSGKAFLDSRERNQGRGYFGPEIYDRAVWRRQIDWKAVDMYTIGVNLYTFCMNSFPFKVLKKIPGANEERRPWGKKPEGQDEGKIALKINLKNACPLKIKYFIMDCLRDDPQQRITASQALHLEMFTPDPDLIFDDPTEEQPSQSTGSRSSPDPDQRLTRPGSDERSSSMTG